MKLRADPRLGQAPVIFLTAKTETESRIKRLETGADDYVSKPFDIKELIFLMERKGRVQTRDNLLVNVWNYDTETRTIDTRIRRLREKLGEDANIIETIRGVGYRISGK